MPDNVNVKLTIGPDPFEYRVQKEIDYAMQGIEDFVASLGEQFPGSFEQHRGEDGEVDELRYTFPNGKILEIRPAQVLTVGEAELKGKFCEYRGMCVRVIRDDGEATVEVEGETMVGGRFIGKYHVVARDELVVLP